MCKLIMEKLLKQKEYVSKPYNSMNFLRKILKKISSKNLPRRQAGLTNLKGKPRNLSTREVLTPLIREKLMTDSLVCPYCSSKNFVKRGWRKKRMENVQLLMCNDCHKTFTPQSVKGKHYPLATIFDAISLYNLGYSLEESCRRVNVHASSWNERSEVIGSSKTDAIVPPVAGLQHDTSINPSTLSNWIEEFRENLPFLRMRDFAMQKYLPAGRQVNPQDMIITATLAHRQLYRFRFHRAKCSLIMQENFHHRTFTPLVEFLEMVPGECPHQYFSQGERASETPLTFSKTAMIVRGKTNYVTKLATFVLQGAKERKNRHEILQKFMLYNDSVTVATEVPVYLTKDDLLHMQTQLGFEIYQKRDAGAAQHDVGGEAATPSVILACPESLPKLITGHVDFVQIRNGMIHLLDFKPNAEKERPIEQLTLYAMALSRLTGLRLFEFKCAWFDEKDYFEFYPLHVLHKPKKAIRRRKVETDEGTYLVNKNSVKIENIRPTVSS